MAESEFRVYRRRLPHWRSQGVTYFVTWRLAPQQPRLTPTERSIVCDALKHFDEERYRLNAYVVMDDHVHALVHPLHSALLEDILHTWKSYSAHSLRDSGRIGIPVWQHESFDRIVRDDREFLEKMRYIMGNPWKRWPALEDYRWMHPRRDDLSKASSMALADSRNPENPP
jgi:REP-associated tyrosine transposase